VIDFDAFRGRRVLVTGHTGFKGTWLSLWLHALGARVAGYALGPRTDPNIFDAVRLADCMIDMRGDIRDTGSVLDAVAKFDPEFVFHLAAQAIVRESYRDPVETYAVNVTGTAAILDACRKSPGVRAIVVVTSDKCYENNDWVWGYRENDRLGGFDPYSSSKACAELVTDAFRRSYFQGKSPTTGVGTARAGNVIGGGDWSVDRLVPDLVRSVAAARPAIIRNPHAVRPWQHVLEPLAGYLILALRLANDPAHFSGAWNFGPTGDSVQDVKTIVTGLSECWAGKLAWCAEPGEHPHEATRLLLDSSKAMSVLQWRPRLTLKQALALTAEWYEACLQGEVDLRKLCESQIDAYQDLMYQC